MKKNRIYIILFIVLAVAAAALYLNKSNSTIKQELRDFAVKDTASIDKIFIADRDGKSVTLERKSQSEWILNGKMPARQDGINSVLTAVASMEVRSPVGKNLYNTTMKMLAANGIKVELYSKGELLKTFYVGHPTQDNMGTFMYLEGSSVPFIMHIPGFNGYLTPRFFTSENGWRQRLIYAYSPQFIKSVQVTYLTVADSSFTLTQKNDSTFNVITGTGKEIQPLSREKIASYLLNYRLVGYQKIEESASAGFMDTVMRAGAFARLAVSSFDGKTSEAMLYRRPITRTSIATQDALGNPLPFDLDHLYARLPGDDTWYMCQYHTFDKLLKTPSYFQPAGRGGK